MAVASANHDISKSSSDATPGGARYSESWKVVLDAVPTSALEARQAGGLGTPELVPDTGDAHWDDAGSEVVSVTAKPISEDRLIWLVTATYEPPTADTLRANPLLDTVQKSWGAESRSWVPEKDKDGNAIVNSAGDRFDPSPEEEKFDLTLRITRNEATYDADEAEEYIGGVNDAPVTLVGHVTAAREGRIKEYGGTFRTRNGTDFYEVTYLIVFRKGKWDRDIEDLGMRQRTSATQRDRILDDSGEEVVDAWPLNTPAGTRRASNLNPSFITFKMNDEVDFSTLGLPIA